MLLPRPRRSVPSNPSSRRGGVALCGFGDFRADVGRRRETSRQGPGPVWLDGGAGEDRSLAGTRKASGRRCWCTWHQRGAVPPRFPRGAGYSRSKQSQAHGLLPKAAGAVRLANAYAGEFTRYKARVDATWLRDRSEAVAMRLKVLRDRGGRNSYEYGELLQQQVDLRTVQQFLEKNPPPAAIHSGSASKPRPDALRNGVIGGAIGALLGVVLMVGLSALGLRARR